MSSPALSWDAVLNMTKDDLELILDSDIYLWFGKGMRDGVSYISKRYSKANKKYLKCFDPKQESRCIISLDVYEWYGYAMQKFLRKSGFK